MLKPHTSHTLEIPVAIRNLIADMRGDEYQQHLPVGFAIDLAFRMLQMNVEALGELNEQYANAYWSCYCHGDTAGADKHKLACSYIDCALQIVKP